MIASRRVDSVETVTAGSFHVAFSAMGGLTAKPEVSYRFKYRDELFFGHALIVAKVLQGDSKIPTNVTTR